MLESEYSKYALFMPFGAQLPVLGEPTQARDSASISGS